MGYRNLPEIAIKCYGEDIIVQQWYDEESMDDPLYKIEFVYRGYNIVDWYNRENTNAISLTQLLCRIFDKYGEEGIVKYKKCKEKINEIEEKYLVIHDRVYKFTHIPIEGRHYMSIIMEDNTIINGESPFYKDNPLLDKDRFSFRSTLKNLQLKLVLYIEQKMRFPHNDYYMEKTTKDYLENKETYQKLIS